MSLLMDALKKAEQEKREAAKKLLASEEDLSVTRNRESTPEITDVHPVADSITPEPVTGFAPEDPHDRTNPNLSMDMSLEPLEITANNPLLPKRPPEILSIEERIEAGDPDAMQSRLDGTLQLEPDFSPVAPPVQPARLETTQQINIADTAIKTFDPDKTFHNVNLDQPAVAGLYDDTVQGEPFRVGEGHHSYEETLPGVPAAQLARDIGTPDQPTPVAAQTLFTATGTVIKPSSGFRWLLISLGVLAVVSATVFYYYVAVMPPVTRNIPSPLVAKGVETILSAQDLQQQANTIPAPIGNAVPIEPVVEVAPATITAEPIQPVAADTTAGTDTVADTGMETTETTDITSPIPIAGPGPARQTAATLPAVIQPPAALIRISRNLKANEDGRLINEAFSAWQQGNLELAREKYLQANERLPDNRDVLLGLAAVATRTGDTATALRSYLRLVELNPLDNVARAALINLQPGADALSSISVIKSMLATNPEQPSLYFTLGRLYAAQSNWAAAQQAFFDAYRLDSANPDYAFNLAVSLDRLEQSQAALDYYTVALGLSTGSPAGFNRAAVTERIHTLEAGK